MRLVLLLSSMCVLAAVAFAQTPTIGTGGIVNAASYANSGLQNGAIAEGSLFDIFGTNMGPTPGQSSGSYPLPTTLGGTSISVTVNGTTVAAIPVYTSANQVTAILPSKTPVGSGMMTVSYNGQASAPAPFQVVQSSFGTFSVSQGGSGPGIVTNAKYAVNSFSAPAKPGDTDIIWGTGLGPISSDESQGPGTGNLNIPVTVYIGSQQATITYKGRSGCCSGLDQIGFVVPQGILGCSVPVVIEVNNVVSNFTTMAISSSGACSDPNGFSASTLQQLFDKGTFTIGSIILERDTDDTGITLPGEPSGPTTTDFVEADFERYTLAQYTGSSAFNFTSLGSCTLFTYQSSTTSTIPPITATPLDAGPSITMTGPNGTMSLTESSLGKGFYSTDVTSTTLFLDPGTYAFSNGSGGADVGPFSNASITLPTPLTWTNESSISTISRSQGLTVTWSGGDPSGFVTITGTSTQFDQTTQVGLGGFFSCVAPASAGSFTVPSYVLLSLPQTTVITAGSFSESLGSLGVESSTKPVVFSATGLDYAVIEAGFDSEKTVAYQ